MRFMNIITSAAAAAPTPELMTAMHDLATREIAAGRMISDGGLEPLDGGLRVKISRGKVLVLDGPFTESKEVIGGYAVFEVASREEAQALAEEFMQLHVDHMPGWEGVCEVRAIVGSLTGNA
jgi:hypothetical protein